MSVIYVYEQGVGPHKTVEIVTEDIGKVAEAYIKDSIRSNYVNAYHYPTIQIWEHGKYVGSMHGPNVVKEHVLVSLKSALNR